MLREAVAACLDRRLSSIRIVRLSPQCFSLIYVWLLAAIETYEATGPCLSMGLCSLARALE